VSDTSSHCLLPIPTAGEQAQDGHLAVAYREGHGDPAFEAGDAKPWPDVVPSLPTLGGQVEAKAKAFDAFDVGQRDCGRGAPAIVSYRSKRSRRASGAKTTSRAFTQSS